MRCLFWNTSGVIYFNILIPRCSSSTILSAITFSNNNYAHSPLHCNIHRIPFFQRPQNKPIILILYVFFFFLIWSSKWKKKYTPFNTNSNLFGFRIYFVINNARNWFYYTLHKYYRITWTMMKNCVPCTCTLHKWMHN